MTPAETLTLAAYFFVVIVLAIYGWHRYYLVYLYMSNRDVELCSGECIQRTVSLNLRVNRAIGTFGQGFT